MILDCMHFILSFSFQFLYIKRSTNIVATRRKVKYYTGALLTFTVGEIIFITTIAIGLPYICISNFGFPFCISSFWIRLQEDAVTGVTYRAAIAAKNN